MELDVLHSVMYRLANAPVQNYPFPHFHLENIFPEEFYQMLLDNLPDNTHFESLSRSGKVDPRTYRERFVMPLDETGLNQLPFQQSLFWNKFSEAIQSQRWISMLLEKFGPQIKERFGPHFDKVTFSSTAELIRDRTNYSIGPHTDHPIRVLTLLFYFPSSTNQSHLGTSVYQPLDSTFKCEGFSHHTFESFTKLHTVPFLPNSVFGFIKTDRSFHGVEPIKDREVERTLMNYYLQWNHK